MDAIEFLKEKKRMCKSLQLQKGSCHNCSLSNKNNNTTLYCTDFITDYPEKTVEIVEQWSKSHPRKTILDDFRGKFPNAVLVCGIPVGICPQKLGYIKECKFNRCGTDCWKIPLDES